MESSRCLSGSTSYILEFDKWISVGFSAAEFPDFVYCFHEFNSNRSQ